MGNLFAVVKNIVVNFNNGRVISKLCINKMAVLRNGDESEGAEIKN